MDYDLDVIKKLKYKELPSDKKNNEIIEYTLDDAKFEFTIKEKILIINFYNHNEKIKYHITIPFVKKFNIHVTQEFKDGSNKKNVVIVIKEDNIKRMIKKINKNNSKSKFMMKQEFDPNKFTLYNMPNMDKSYPLHEFIEILRNGIPLKKNDYTSTYVKYVLLFKHDTWIGIGKKYGRKWKYTTQKDLKQFAIKVSKFKYEKRFEKISNEIVDSCNNCNNLVSMMSKYLCRSCHNPIYVDADKNEICINQNCLNCIEKSKITAHDYLMRSLQEKKREHEIYLNSFLMFSKVYFFETMFKIRHNIISNYFNNGVCDFQKLIHINYVLIKIMNCEKWGADSNNIKFEKILDQSFEKFNMIAYMEDDIQTERSIGIIKNNSPEKYTSKYSEIINYEFKVNLGIIEIEKNTIEDIDKNNYFGMINQRVTDKPKGLYDTYGIYRKNYPIVVPLIYAFRNNETAANMHDHPGSIQDLLMLNKLLQRLEKNKYISLTRSELEEIHNELLLEHSLKNSFTEFEKNYCSNKYVPVLIFNGKEYLASFETLYMYILYINTRNVKCTSQQKLSGKDTLSIEKQKSANLFEKDIRKRLKRNGFDTYPNNDDRLKSRYEYDCIAINEKEMTIMLIEAKFEDMSPASIITKNFLKDLVLKKETGLVAVAYRQNERKKYFTKNFKTFPFKLKNKFSNYKIQTFVITKFTPIIHKCFNVDIISHKNFCEYYS